VAAAAALVLRRRLQQQLPAGDNETGLSASCTTVTAPARQFGTCWGSGCRRRLALQLDYVQLGPPA